MEAPQFTSLLLVYGKYVVKTMKNEVKALKEN